MRSSLAERLSIIIDVPVSQNDGLSQHICRPCNRKFLAAESLTVLAKDSYIKCRAVLSRPLSVYVGILRLPRSPQGRDQRTPVGFGSLTRLDHQTVGTSDQRRLSFPVQDESKTIS